MISFALSPLLGCSPLTLLTFIKQVKEKVEARNELESYTYSLKNQIGDKEKLGGKLSDEDKTTVEEAVEKV